MILLSITINKSHLFLQLRGKYKFHYRIPTLCFKTLTQVFFYNFFYSDYRTDGYHWRQQGGKNYEIEEGVWGKKIPFYSRIGDHQLSSEFKREVYWDPRYPLRFLIHYLGNADIQVDLPHGNAKGKKRKMNFFTTRKSSRDEMKVRPGLPSNVYKELVCEAPEEAFLHAVSAPRNQKQVENFQANERHKLRISRDAYYNLLINSNQDKSIKKVEIYPDFLCIIYLDQLAKKIVGLINRTDLSSAFGLQYDTTFKLADAYVSVLIARFTEFEEAPVVPFVFMIHDRKTTETHDTFFRKYADYFPQLVRSFLCICI